MIGGRGLTLGRAVWLALALLLGACGSNTDAPWLRAGGDGAGRYQGPPPPSVVVQRGDTVYAISRRFGVPVKDIIQANGLAPPYTLHVGQRLALPRPQVHMVRRGDTLSGIARAYGVDMGRLAAVNGLRPPYLIRVGERLALPATGGGGGTASGTQVATRSTATAPSSSVAPKPAVRAEAPPAPPPRAGKSFAWPVEGKLLSGFGPSSAGERNDGINIAVAHGTPVKAAENGVVVYSGNELKGFGNLLLVKHDGGWVTAYAHNDTLLAKRGQKVRRGEVIAKAGQTGNVHAPQVHFEVRQGSKAVDPLAYLERAVASR
jgi:murein DD-endopeptidase MepM/ murein hydrolase activator NlpD